MDAMTQLQAQMSALLSAHLPGSPQAAKAYNQILDLLDEAMSTHSAMLPAATRIHADTVRIMVTDQQTGQTVLRDLPLEYAETANGITLSGENYEGHPAQIAFFSQSEAERLLDLQGQGLDKPRCHY